MHWIIIAIFAYFLVALEIVFDKFLLSSKKVSHPAIYTFYAGVLSIFTFVLFPFGTKMIEWGHILVYVIAGIVFVYGILAQFFAITKSEASRVIPVVGATIPIVTYVFSVFFLEEKLTFMQTFGSLLLIFGGLLISFEFPLRKKKKFFQGFYYSIAAGILLALAFSLFKGFYEKDQFLNVFVWTRLGLVAGALSLLIYAPWNKIIINSLFHFKKPKREQRETGIFFVLNKFLGGLGSILTHYAISLGSVTIVNALVSTEYVFVLLFGLSFSFKFPSIFKEDGSVLNVLQKIISILIISLGIILVSF